MRKTKDFLTPEELSERWSLSKGHLANMRSMGKGPKFLKIGNAIRYSISEVLEYEKSNTFSET